MTISPNKISHFEYNNPSKLAQLERMSIKYIDNIYSYFNIKPSYISENIIKSSCFVHGGDNDTSLNLYPNGDIRVHYKCRTHGCEDVFGSSLISLMRGGLSAAKYGWSKQGDKEASFNESVEFLLNIIGQKFDELDESSCPSLEKMKFATMISKLYTDDKTDAIITRDGYSNTVSGPPSYYIDRNFKPETLIKFGVGFCSTRGKQMFNRAIVPIFDNNYEYVVGISGRSVFDRCAKCKYYHDPNERCKFFPKWRHSKGFQKEKWLYNFWNAKSYIQESKTIILVESPGNVWRLHEAGIYNAVAIFGTSLNDIQRSVIDESGALSIVLLMDNDEAGERASEKILQSCNRLYDVHMPKILKNDIGDMTIEEINLTIKPLLHDVMEKYK